MYIFDELNTSGHRVESLDIIAVLAILSSIVVIISKNPIISVLFLISLFLCIAGYLLIIGLNFIGLSYLLVYVGAVSILFLFILMLLNIRISELSDNTINSLPLAILITISFYYPLYPILPYSIYFIDSYLSKIYAIIYNSVYYTNLNNIIILSYNEFKLKLFFVSCNIWDGNLAETSHITSIGNVMYTNYSIWLILTSIILLLAMVGTIVITIKQKN